MSSLGVVNFFANLNPNTNLNPPAIPNPGVAANAVAAPPQRSFVDILAGAARGTADVARYCFAGQSGANLALRALTVLPIVLGITGVIVCHTLYSNPLAISVAGLCAITILQIMSVAMALIPVIGWVCVGTLWSEGRHWASTVF